MESISSGFLPVTSAISDGRGTTPLSLRCESTTQIGELVRVVSGRISSRMASSVTESTSVRNASSRDGLCSLRNFSRLFSCTSPSNVPSSSTTGSTFRSFSRILRIAPSGPSFIRSCTICGLSIMIEEAVTIRVRSTFSTKRLTYSLAGEVSICSEVPTCTISPSFMMAMRSPSLIASFRSWVIKTIVFFILACKASSSSCIWMRIKGSRAEKASSMSNTSGLLARARANPTRCCIPPESCRIIWLS